MLYDNLSSALDLASLAAGEYLIAYTFYSHNYGGEISGFGPGTSDIRGPYAYTINFRQAVDGTPNNAVPEPASVALLGLGLAGLAAARRRKQA